MLRSIFRTDQFKRDFKRLLRKHFDPNKMTAAVKALMAQDKELLKREYPDHALKANSKGYREIHLEGDWLVIYRVESDILELVLVRTGTHDELF